MLLTKRSGNGPKNRRLPGRRRRRWGSLQPPRYSLFGHEGIDFS
jgi:hypothetical protein